MTALIFADFCCKTVLTRRQTAAQYLRELIVARVPVPKNRTEPTVAATKR
ncbi:MAG: hypothetical protein PHT00_02675 [Candidatus Methanomethylophilus sp.]|nr:hypothetical protein [Methanomethylophilus sp.]MDD3233057.1 hypothetical protein [Methanomethylophilus sp.]MDD4222228.1 hypothetical protein [Methanomethylophilus sp.]